MPKSKDNSAVEFLLDRINDLTRRVVALEDRQYPTFSSITNTPTVNAVRNSISNTRTTSDYTIWATPTVTRAEMTAYWQSIADMYVDRLDEIQRQLNNLNNTPRRIPEDADVEPMTFEIRDGNVYINPLTNEWAANP